MANVPMQLNDIPLVYAGPSKSGRPRYVRAYEVMVDQFPYPKPFMRAAAIHWIKTQLLCTEQQAHYAYYQLYDLGYIQRA